MILSGLIPSGRREGPPPAAQLDPQPPLFYRDNGQIVLSSGNSDPIFLDQMKVGFRRYTLGCDIGGAGNDPSAMVLLESECLPFVDINNRHHLHPIERTVVWSDMIREPYTPSLVTFITKLMLDIRQRVSPSPVAIAHDATGMGAPYTSLFKQAKLKPNPILFTGGEAATRINTGGGRIAKNTSIEDLTVALHNGSLKIADDLPQKETIQEHLASIEMVQSASGRATYKQGGQGHHSDLASALAVAWAFETRFRR